MAFSGKSSSSSGMATLDKSKALPARWVSENSGKLPVLGAALPGTGFKILPPLAIPFKPFHFLKCLSLNSVGLGLESVPFHSGWELVVWKSKLSVLELHAVEILEIYEDVEVDDSVEVFGPLIELDLGEGSSIHDVGETPIEAAGVAPSVVVEVEEESSVKFVEAKASLEKKEGDQAKGTGSEPVLESVEKELRDQAVEARGEPAHDIEVERIGAEPVLENVEDRSGAESDLMEVEQVVRTEDEPVHEAEELRTGKKLVVADVETGTGDMPVREMEMGDSHYEDF